MGLGKTDPVAVLKGGKISQILEFNPLDPNTRIRTPHKSGQFYWFEYLFWAGVIIWRLVASDPINTVIEIVLIIMAILFTKFGGWLKLAIYVLFILIIYAALPKQGHYGGFQADLLGYRIHVERIGQWE